MVGEPAVTRALSGPLGLPHSAEEQHQGCWRSTPAMLQQGRCPAPHSSAMPGQGFPKARPVHAPTSWPVLSYSHSQEVPDGRSWGCPGASTALLCGWWDWAGPGCWPGCSCPALPSPLSVPSPCGDVITFLAVTRGTIYQGEVKALFWISLLVAGAEACTIIREQTLGFGDNDCDSATCFAYK